jgi:predicted  nucleic acid-binding Zn-ribbon protein
MKTAIHPHSLHVATALLLLCCLGCNSLTDRGPQGYLASDKNGVIFIQFAEQGGQLSGQMQFFGAEGRGWKKTEANNASFTGLRDGSNVSLRFAGFFTDRTINGTLSGDTLSLVLPQPDGRLATVGFRRASVGEYNAEVQKIRGQVAKTNEATRRAQAEESRLEQLRQSAAQADDNIRRAYESLNEELNGLGDALQFDRPLAGFDQHWREMQEHEQEFKVKAAVRPLDSYKLSAVDYALQKLEYDQQHIEHDRQNLGYAITKANEKISDLRDGVAALQKAWEELQAARSSEAGAYMRSEVDEEDIAGIKTRDEAEIKKLEETTGKADARARGIERKANNLYVKSQALLDRLKASSEDN